MKRFITFGSIEKIETVVRNISHQARYIGLDEDGNPKYNPNQELPKIVAIGTEKIHGSNAAVCYSIPDGFWVQSRKNIITPESDNAGCAFAATQNQNAWMIIIGNLAEEYNIDLNENIISVYYEWSGGNIQKKSAVTGLDKRAIIFRYFKVSPMVPQMDDQGQETRAVWKKTVISVKADSDFSVWVNEPIANIYNIMNFPTASVEIDFNSPKMSFNKMIELVDILEESSLVGEAFNIKGNIGEGYVFTFEYKDNVHRFKVKGEKHANSKVKTLSPVDEEKEQVKIEFANYAANALRLEQAWQNTFGIENELMEPTVAATGTFMRFVIADVWKEESEVAHEKGLEPKVVNGMISKVARAWFMEQLQKEAGF